MQQSAQQPDLPWEVHIGVLDLRAAGQSQARTVARTAAIPHVQPFAVFLEIASSERSQSLDTCSPETVHSAGHSPPGSGRKAATPEPSSRRWEPALYPLSAGSHSVGCDRLFWSQHNNKN